MKEKLSGWANYFLLAPNKSWRDRMDQTPHSHDSLENMEENTDTVPRPLPSRGARSKGMEAGQYPQGLLALN